VFALKSPPIRFGLRATLSQPDWSQYLINNPVVQHRRLLPVDATHEDGLAISRLFHDVGGSPLSQGETLESSHIRSNQADIANPQNFFYLVKKDENPALLTRIFFEAIVSGFQVPYLYPN
jgi:hypothetical protein